MTALGLRFGDALDFTAWLADVTTISLRESESLCVRDGEGVDCGCENEEADRVDELHLEGVDLFVVRMKILYVCSLYGWIDLILLALKKSRAGGGGKSEAFILPNVPCSQ